ncbi:MAG: hypothetical protein K9M84_01405 [Spirochaetia bacterium]|nr:hypothetical protein [Spirochaetia bacterium]MCF7940247.1 hypothetical protein [Spirochaetia bacterium]
MKQCRRCNAIIADGEPCCPLCGPEAPLVELPGSCPRSPYPAHPKIIRLKVRSIIAFDMDVFFFLSSVLFLFSCLLILIDSLESPAITWSRYPIASLLLLWAVLVLPYAFMRYTGYTYVLISAISLSLFLFFIDLQSGTLSWSVIPTVVLTVPAAVNWLYYYRKRP